MVTEEARESLQRVVHYMGAATWDGESPADRANHAKVLEASLVALHAASANGDVLAMTFVHASIGKRMIAASNSFLKQLDAEAKATALILAE